MRRIKPSLRNSLWAMLGYSPSIVARTDTLGPVRQRMLELLGDAAELKHPTLVQRIQSAREAEALWYARHDLVVALAGVHGEAAARQHVVALNALFTGLLPPSLIGHLRAAPSVAV